MAEAMAIEIIAAEYAKIQGYLTETRVPYPTKKGANSDLDVIGYHPKRRRSLLVECKAYGSPDKYWSWDDYPWFKKNVLKMKAGWQRFSKSKTNRWGLKDSPDEAWFVVPASCVDKKHVEEKLTKLVGFKVRVLPIHELLLSLISLVATDKDVRRTRYADTASEFCRWLVRSYDKKAFTLQQLEAAINGK